MATMYRVRGLAPNGRRYAIQINVERDYAERLVRIYAAAGWTGLVIEPMPRGGA